MSTMPKTLFILNDPPYGTERGYNALRLAGSLSKREGEEVKVFLVGDAASCAKNDQKVPQGVGRPDLHADREVARQRARALIASLTRLRALRSRTVVLPAHASEPIAFDGRAVAAQMGDVEAWLSGWLASETAFIERVTSKLPPTPPNFARIVELNEAGEFPASDPTDLEAGANRCAVR
jgi:hypothetical protein